jgi:hypothetical protein
MSDLPDTVFHYTTAAGLLGILRDSVLWATDLRFLNDAQEAVFARDLFLPALRDISNPAASSEHPFHHNPEGFGAAFEQYKHHVEQVLGSDLFSIYVACFCESGDLLSTTLA